MCSKSFVLIACLVLTGLMALHVGAAKAQDAAKPEELQERGGAFFRNGDAQPFTGPVREQHETGKPRLEANYQNGKLVSSKVWYESGVLAEDVVVADEVWTIKRYGENGNIEEETVAQFRNGRKISERSKLWYESGKLRMEAGFEGGKLAGPLKEYDERGGLIRDELYQKGVLVQKVK